mmetsp:Transcript_2146/g.2426  ORF Transcript_2146/g.2426 Transcript_2146/m.2426 type:complete len:103 (-) Transcript_2146:703-1011(-)
MTENNNNKTRAPAWKEDSAKYVEFFPTLQKNELEDSPLPAIKTVINENTYDMKEKDSKKKMKKANEQIRNPRRSRRDHHRYHRLDRPKRRRLIILNNKQNMR